MSHQPSYNQYYSRRSAVPSAPIPRRRRRLWLLVLPVVALIVSTVGFHMSGNSSAAIPSIKSALGDYCLDLQDDNMSNNTAVNGRPCRANEAQAWSVRQDTVQHENNVCLSVSNNSKSAHAAIVAITCQSEPGQIWLRDQAGLYNPNSRLCLSLSGSNPQGQLQTAACAQPNTPTQEWLPEGPARTQLSSVCAQTTGGERIACFAEQQWSRWQSGSPNHEALLNDYTDGTPYEEWCADFVSYVYRQAGMPFVNGSADGWDENNANNIQYMGFTMHDPSTYTPKAGDVAYFDYNGGHVEIVVSGGKTPTFVYGNSATIDPTTGNGQMQANTITSDGPEGRLMYYLSPN